MGSENVEPLVFHDLNGRSGFKLALPRCTYELDQPAVLSFKREVLDEQGAIAVGIRTAVAADLRARLGRRNTPLTENGRTTPTGRCRVSQALEQ